MPRFAKKYGQSSLEMSKEDIKKNPEKPVVRFYDEDELIGIFDLKTSNILYDNDMAYYDVDFAKEEIEKNRENWLETWQDYVEGIANA